MEVHHHPDLHHKPKAWKEYLLEGLMIFLAVFMGFIAENIREGITERAKGKEYLRSFVEDLQSDTLQYGKLLSSFETQTAALNQIESCYDTIISKPGSTGCVLNFLDKSNSFPDFVYTDRTIQQVKNSGGLRLIHNQAIADSIILYDSRVRAEMIHQESMERWLEMLSAQHADMIGLKQFSNSFALKRGKHLSESNDELMTTNKAELNAYFNKIIVFRNLCNIQIRHLHKLKSRASRVIAFIKEQEE